MLPQIPALRRGGRMRIFANPDGTLPFSEWEGHHLKRTLPQEANLHIRAQAATKPTHEWQDDSIVHFSCHGSGQHGFAPLSSLRLSDDMLFAHDVAYRRPPLRQGSLVVLNGCQTSVRDWRAAEEGLGLHSAFLSRGAALTLATQWSVDDLCAAVFTTTFMNKLENENLPPTEALRAAQDRARTISCAEVRGIAERLKEEQFTGDGFEHDRSRIDAVAARACRRGGDADGLRRHALSAALALRDAGLRDESDHFNRVAREAAVNPRGNMDDPAYAHPMYWSAFQLVGRVT